LLNQVQNNYLFTWPSMTGSAEFSQNYYKNSIWFLEN